MPGRSSPFALAVPCLALLASGLAGGTAAPVLQLVVLGDSFTAALDTQTLRDDPTISWATGDRLESPSVAQRLAGLGWDARATNFAFSGARTIHLIDQVRRAPADADVVLVWIGTNDLCTSELTADRFLDEARRGYGAIDERYPDATVIAFAPPSLAYIGRQHESTPEAAELWSQADVCTQFFGAHRAPVAAADRQARFDAALETAAAENGFHYSRSLETMRRPLSEWASWDYLHPSPAGSALFAERAWPDVRDAVGPPGPERQGE